MKILIVDDSRESRYLIESLLKVSGHEVVMAENGLEALRLLKDDPIDMIISDILMPGMDGFQLCWHCKGDEELKKTPFVFYTATYTDRKDEEFALSLGAERFIVKPVQPEDFLKIIEGVIREHQEGSLTVLREPVAEESVYLAQYNQRLIAKLEKKMLDLQKTHRDLRESEKHYRELVESINDGVVVIDHSGRPDFVNPIFCRMTGYTAEELRALHFTSLIHPDDVSSCTGLFEDTLAGKERGENHEARFITRSGNETWVEMNCNAFMRGESVAGVLAIMRNITKRKLAEKELRRNYHLQNVINELLSLSLENLDLQEITDRALEHILSIPSLAMQSQGGIFFVEDQPDILALKSHRGFSGQLQQSCAQVPFGKCVCGRAAQAQEFQYVGCVNNYHQTRNGDMTPHGHYCVPIMFAGKTLGVIDIVLEENHGRDRKEEEFLTAVANTLASIIIRRQVESEKEKIQSQLLLSQKMEGLGRLAGGVAHDFNNYLTAILGNAELLTMKLEEDDPNRERARVIQETTLRAAHLTQQLLAFSRRQSLEPVVMNLNDTLHLTEKIIPRLVGEDIECHFDLQPDLKNIKADPGQMEQVLINLVVNSRDAMPNGGKLFISTENIFLDMDSCRLFPGMQEGHYVLLSVTDTGAGMSEEVKNRILEPFFTTKESGTGLGLSTSYGIVRQFGGDVHIYSEAGQGTTFKIYFPCTGKEGDEVKSAKAPTFEKTASGTGTILVVEDNPDILGLAEASLPVLGYTVLTAASADEALRIVRELTKPIDLLLTDVVLPFKRGPEITTLLKDRYPGLKVLYMSGYGDPRLFQTGISGEKVHFLSKPFTITALAGKIREVLHGKE